MTGFRPFTLLIILVSLMAIAVLGGCSHECVAIHPQGGTCPAFKL